MEILEGYAGAKEAKAEKAARTAVGWADDTLK